jgi:hypothetical protein
LPADRSRLVDIPEREEKASKITEKNLTPWEQHQENYRKVQQRVNQYDAPYTYPQTNEKSYIFLLVFGFIGVMLFIILAANSKSCLSRPLEVKEKAPLKTVTTPKIEYPVPTPVPQINYQVKVQWNGNNDMEHFENPQIDNSKLPTFDENELKKTVFKNRGVQVKITIDTTGEVTSAEAISGHPLLKEAAVNAARKTLFNSRSKPTSRILTYYFRLVSE